MASYWLMQLVAGVNTVKLVSRNWSCGILALLTCLSYTATQPVLADDLTEPLPLGAAPPIVDAPPAVAAPSAPIAPTAPTASTAAAASPLTGGVASNKTKHINVSAFDILPLPTAVQFPIVFDTELDSRNTRQGDLVEAHLKDDLVFDGRLIAPAGSIVLGHVEHFVKARTMTQAMSSTDKRFHKTSIIKLSFTEIITPEQEHLKIEGILSQQSAQFGEKIERQVVVGKEGIVDSAEQMLPEDTFIGAQVVNFTLGTGIGQLGTVASFGVLPIVMGAIGAVNPSIITFKAVTKEDKHPRWRGFTMGVVSSLPAGNVVQSMIYHGSELNIHVGDELLVQAHSPYQNSTTTTKVSAKIVAGKSDSGDAGGPPQVGATAAPTRHYYPKYQPKWVPKAGDRVLGINQNKEDKFGFWQ